MKTSVKRARQAERKMRSLQRQLDNRARAAEGLRMQAAGEQARAEAALKLMAATLRAAEIDEIRIPGAEIASARPEHVKLKLEPDGGFIVAVDKAV